MQRSVGVELAAFNTPRRKPTKLDLAVALLQADNDFRFDFFGLPPEVRNIIYEDLLICHCSATGKCYAQILRTCKQANEEARGLLY